MPVIDTDTDEGKAALQKLIEDATKGLAAKRDELLGDQKKLKDSMKAVQAQLDKLAEEKEAAEAAAAAKSGDFEKIKASLETKAKKENEELKTKLERSTGLLNQTLLDKGLAEALIKANVATQHLPAVKALIKTTAKAEIVDKDGEAVATFDGKPIEEFVSTWAQGELGKHYIAAPSNGGGGANGSNGGGKANTDKGNLGGSKAERVAAIAQRFPDLKTTK